MSKTSSSSSSIFIPYNPSSSIMVNGKNKAEISVTPWGTSSYYNMDENEKKAYDYAGEQFALNLPNLNVFDADTQKRFDNQVQSYINQGIEDINDIYKPMLDDLQNDIASRFGNLDNSIFMDNLSEIEDKRADSISDFAQDVQTYRQDLVNNELSNRYNYLDYLNNYVQQVNSNILNTLGASQNLSDLSNSYFSSFNNLLNKNSQSSNSSGFDISRLFDKVIDAALSNIRF